MSCCTTKPCPDSPCPPEQDYDYESLKIVVWAVGDIADPTECGFEVKFSGTFVANEDTVSDGSFTVTWNYTSTLCDDGDGTFTKEGPFVEGHTYSYDLECLPCDATDWESSDTNADSVSDPTVSMYCKETGSGMLAELINTSTVDRLLLLGNLYQCNYQNTVGLMFGDLLSSDRISPIKGNYDWDLNDGSEYESFFNVPNYYKKTIGNTDFFMLDSGWNSEYELKDNDGNTEGTLELASPKCCGLGYARELGTGSDQWSWFVDEVKASTAKFKVVCIHHPPWTSGNSHWGENPEISRWGSHFILQWSAFKKLGIDLVLSAHENVYERLEVDGVRFVVCGTGGAPLGTFGDPPLDTSIYRYNSNYGALQLTITNDHLYGRFVTVDGTIRDQFTI